MNPPAPARSLPGSLIRGLLVLVTAAAAFLPALPASAHGFSSTVYATVTQPDARTVRAEVDLEYVLLVISAAEAKGDRDFESEAKASAATSLGDHEVLDAHADTVAAYIDSHFAVARDGADCLRDELPASEIALREDVPYAHYALDYVCPSTEGAIQITSTLFPAGEQVVGQTKTVVEYDVDGETGSVALDSDSDPSFETGGDVADNAWEWFALGAEHLLTGLDHILFLLALIVGSRRLRDVLLVATTFTIAHSVTFILAALGAVSVPAVIVEPLIAFSIAVVGTWYLWSVWRSRRIARAAGIDLTTEIGVEGRARTPWWRMDRQDILRLTVVFLFGLIHGVGFAGALGIDEPFSWVLLGSLLIFNLGIEAVQVGIILIVFPMLLLLRRMLPPVGMWVGIVIAACVAIVGLYWFVERILALG